MLDPSLLPQGKPIDLTAIRVADVAERAGGRFQPDRQHLATDRPQQHRNRAHRGSAIVFCRSSQARRARRGGNAWISSAQSTARCRSTALSRSTGNLRNLHLRADRQNGRITSLNGAAVGLPLSAFLHRDETATEPAFGIKSSADLTIKATRAAESVTPTLQLNGRSNDGRIRRGRVLVGAQTLRTQRQPMTLPATGSKSCRRWFALAGRLFLLPAPIADLDSATVCRQERLFGRSAVAGRQFVAGRCVRGAADIRCQGAGALPLGKPPAGVRRTDGLERARHGCGFACP